MSENGGREKTCPLIFSPFHPSILSLTPAPGSSLSLSLSPFHLRSIWDLRAGACVASLPTDACTTSLEASQDGAAFVTAGGKAACIWDARALAAGPCSTFAFPYTVESASLASSKARIAVGGEDMWVHLLDVASGQEVDTCKGHHGPVHAVRFAPCGGSYASGSEDGTIRIWEAEPVARPPPPGPAAGEAEGAAVVAAA